MIGLKGHKFSGFDGGHPGVITRKFGKDWSKTMPEGLFFQNFLVGVTTWSAKLCLNHVFLLFYPCRPKHLG